MSYIRILSISVLIVALLLIFFSGRNRKKSNDDHFHRAMHSLRGKNPKLAQKFEKAYQRGKTSKPIISVTCKDGITWNVGFFNCVKIVLQGHQALIYQYMKPPPGSHPGSGYKQSLCTFTTLKRGKMPPLPAGIPTTFVHQNSN